MVEAKLEDFVSFMKIGYTFSTGSGEFIIPKSYHKLRVPRMIIGYDLHEALADKRHYRIVLHHGEKDWECSFSYWWLDEEGFLTWIKENEIKKLWFMGQKNQQVKLIY